MDFRDWKSWFLKVGEADIFNTNMRSKKWTGLPHFPCISTCLTAEERAREKDKNDSRWKNFLRGLDIIPHSAKSEY